MAAMVRELNTQDEQGKQSMSRRSVLRGVAGSATLASFGSVQVSATKEETPVNNEEQVLAREEFNTQRRAQIAVEQHASEILDELSSRGLIETATVEALPMDSIEAQSADVTEGTKIFGTTDDKGKATAELTVFMERDGRTIHLTTRPHSDQSHAVIKSGEDTELIDASGNNVGIQKCEQTTYCNSYRYGCDTEGACTEETEECCFTGGSTVDCRWVSRSECGCYC